MEELQNLIAHLKNQGLTDAKIPIDVWCGIIEYFANKQETKQCNIADVSQQRELLFCGGCGNKKQLIVETDINSQRVCKNKLCKQNNC